MRVLFLAVALMSVAGLRAQGPLDEALPRLAEEAEVFRAQARDMISQETLTHRWAKAGKRFKQAGAGGQPPMEYLTRTVVSEYGFGSLDGAPALIHEFRKIVSIDGRPLVDSGKAREVLSLNLKSPDDKAKRDLLREFSKAGIEGGVADFGQLILLFTKRGQTRFEFEERGARRVGADICWVIGYREKGQSLLVFEGKKATHQALSGEVLVRHRDLLPARVIMSVVQPPARKDDPEVEIVVSVDYEQTPHGVLMPVAITHRETAKEMMLTENMFTYTPFRRFSAGAEIKFDEAKPEAK